MHKLYMFPMLKPPSLMGIFVFLKPGIYISSVGPSWDFVFLHIHSACPILGGDISSGECKV